jgi:hypothetical protein
MLMVLSMALLVAPAMQHRLVEGGNTSERLLRATTLYAGASLVPLRHQPGAGDLHRDRSTLWHVGRRHLRPCHGWACGLFWFGIEAFVGWSEGGNPNEGPPTPLTTKVEQLLTEARVIIPGGQALFGFQFIAMLTKGFDQLPASSQLLALGIAAELYVVSRRSWQIPDWR